MPAEASVMKMVLNRYEDISGQMINYSKSAIIFSTNTSEINRTQVCAQLGVNETHTPSTYLGMPMYIGQKKTGTFSFLLDKVEQKLQCWQNQPLSKAGKVTLLKMTTQVIPNFWMNMLLIPIEVCEGIEKMMNSSGGAMVDRVKGSSGCHGRGCVM